MPEGYLMTQEIFDFLRTLKKEYDERRRQAVPRHHRVESAPNLQYVQVTSLTQTADRYPGKLYLYLPATKTFEEKGLVWVVFLNGETPSTGIYYRALEHGYQNNRPVFSATNNGDELVKVTQLDTEAGYLNDKLQEGNYIQIEKLDFSGSEWLEINGPKLVSSDGTITATYDPFTHIWDLSAVCCQSGSGSGSGSGEPHEPVQTACCAEPVPGVLLATVVGTGECTCLDGTYTLNYSEEDSIPEEDYHIWRSVRSAVCGWDTTFPNGFQIILICDAETGGWQAGFACDGEGTNFTLVSEECDPFEIVLEFGEGASLHCCPSPGGEVTVTITEAP